jgi:hypothetical protein
MHCARATVYWNACTRVYWNMWPVWLYNIFPHLFHKRHNFWKKVIEHTICVFSPKFLSGSFLILWRIQWDTVINIHSTSCKVPAYSFQILIQLELSWQIFVKHSNIKYKENPTSGSGVVPYGQTDRYDKDNSHFYNFAKVPKNWYGRLSLICTAYPFLGKPLTILRPTAKPF